MTNFKINLIIENSIKMWNKFLIAFFKTIFFMIQIYTFVNFDCLTFALNTCI